MCFSSGKSAARRAQRQADQEAGQRNLSVDKINALYGIDTNLSPATAADAPAVAANKRALDVLYGSMRGDVLGNLTAQMSEQNTDARRNLLFGLARAGQAGGSVDLEQTSRVGKAYQRGLLSAALRADSAVSSARQNDEGTRLDLIQRVNAGMDGGDALASASRSLAENRNAAQQQALVGGVGSLFSDIALAQQQQQQFVAGGGFYPSRRNGAPSLGSAGYTITQG